VNTVEREEFKYSQDKDFKFKSTPKMMEDFLQTVMWEDMKSLLTQNLIGLRSELEVTEDIDFVRGQIFNIRFALGVPEMILEDLKSTINGEEDDYGNEERV